MINLRLPVFETPRNRLRGRVLFILQITMIIGGLLVALFTIAFGDSAQSWLSTIYRIIIMAMINLVALVFLFRRWLDLAGYLTLATILAFSFIQMLDSDGIHDSAILLYPLLFIIASLLLKRWGYALFLSFVFVSVVLVGWLEFNAYLTSPVITYYYNNGPLLLELLSVLIMLMLGAVAIHLIINNMLANIDQVQNQAQAMQNANWLLDQRIQERTATLQAANRELEDFAYSIAHDLRSPLRGIAGYARLLELDHADHLDADGLQMLERINTGAQRMDLLTRELLNFSRISRKPLIYVRLDMAHLAHLALANLQAEMEGRQVEVNIAELPPCWGDRELLSEVLGRLLNNALKFTRPRSPARIEIGWLAQPTQVSDGAYFVSDNGIGFDMKYIDRLFDIFQRLHVDDETGETPAFEGTGIGLAAVKRIIERHGGQVWAESSVDRGATIYFAIPPGQ